MSAININNNSNSPPSKSLQVANHQTTTSNMTTHLCQRYEQLLRSEKYFDCVFHIGSATLKCHKLILTAASPVFEAMFYGPICEQKQEIEILDISSEIFYELLSYIYTGLVNLEKLSLEEAIELYYGAEKYLLVELIGACLSAIKRKLRFANILPALELSVCMNLEGLLDVCLDFFARCCLSDPQYMAYLKHDYLHVSKECIKTIIATNQDFKHLLWFVFEWCQHECSELGLQKSDCNLIINDLQLNAKLLQNGELSQHGLKRPANISKSIERSYYKACRPFTIGYDAQECHVTVRCDRFISLLGIIINSRLIPSPTTLTAGSMNHISAAAVATAFPTEYKESLKLEIRAKKDFRIVSTQGNSDVDDDDDDHEESDSDYVEDPVIWSYTLKKQPTKYNCDLNVQWDEDVFFSPDVEYQIKLIWQSDAYGAEYPCSLLSNEVDGIKFKDFGAHCGSLIKGLRFLNLVEV